MLIFTKYYLLVFYINSPWHSEVCLLVAAVCSAFAFPLGVENSGPVPLFLFSKTLVSLIETLFTHRIMRFLLSILQNQSELF